MTEHSYRRTPKNYDGNALTSHTLQQVLPSVLIKIGRTFEGKGEWVLRGWPQVIGPQLAPMTEAVSFQEGILVVKVKNSTLYTLLSRNDKPHILKKLREHFPEITVRNIFFKMG